MRYLYIKLITLIFILSTISISAQTESPFVRYPSLNNDGSKIAFSFQGDIWTMPSTGGTAYRLTIHEAYDGHPKWSPDDSHIAFSSDRFGNDDIYVIPAEGGTPKRITYHSSGDELYSWAQNNNLLFTTSRLFQQIEWDHQLEKVPADGGTPTKLISSIGEMPVMSPDGKFIAFIRGWGRITREEYRGSANYDIWIYNTETENYTKVTDFKGHDVYPDWGDANILYYVSASSGIYNIYKLKINDDGTADGNPEQLTFFKEDGIRNFDVSGDGSTIAFSRQADIYTMKSFGSDPKKVNINIAADYRFDPIEHKTYSNHAEDYAVSPNGKLTAYVVRGEIFVKENDKERSRSVNLTKHPYRDQMPTWLSDTTLVFVSDRSGKNDLYLIKSADKNEPSLFKSLKHETKPIISRSNEIFDPLVSPDGNQIIYRVGNGKLIAAYIKPNGQAHNERILLDGWDTPGSIAWSPDSRWIAYQLSDLNFNSEIYIQNVDGESDPVNVSMHPRYDFNPFWSADGSKLGFVSQRNNNNFDVWFAWLKKSDWEKTQRDWEESDDKSTTKEKGKDSTKVKPIVIDLENIYQRLTQVTSLPGDENQVAISNDGKTFYFTAQSTAGKGTDLFSIKWDGKEIKEITGGGVDPSQLKMDKDGSHLYFMKKGGTLARVETKTGKDEGLPFSGTMVIDHQKEKNQMFDEAWRALNEGFYDPDFHGHDWNALKKKYKPWAMATSTQKDFRDIFNELLGQLNASHMGLRNVRERSETQKEKTGLIGTVIKPLDNGVEVTHVVKDSPADRVQSKLTVGDIILSVNGKTITSKDNFYKYLVNTENDQVLLNVKNKEGETRDVVIRPTSSLRNELYNEWVDQRSKLTDKYSNGRLGYMHIRGMNWPSFERFEREFTARGEGKDGIVIDVRFNGGGWTTDYLMLVLNYKQHAYTIPRGAADNLTEDHTKFRNYYPIGERLPYSAWLKPSIAMCNQNSYSNAEIFSHAYKNLGIGKLVGVPTFGAVISTGGHGLIDGSYVRMPFRGWYVKATDKNMDFSPAVPDITVENAPDSKSKGEDPQLKRAVEELMKELKNN